MPQFGINKNLCIRKKKEQNYRRGTVPQQRHLLSHTRCGHMMLCIVLHDITWWLTHVRACVLWHAVGSVIFRPCWHSLGTRAGTAHGGNIQCAGSHRELADDNLSSSDSFGEKNEKFWFDFNFDGFGSRWHIYLNISLRTALKQSRRMWVWSSFFFFFLSWSCLFV